MDTKINVDFTDSDELLSALKSVSGISNTYPENEILLSTPRSSVRTTIKFAGTHFGGHGRITTLIAPAGGGKTQVTEAMVSSFLNSHVDALGFEIIPHDERPLLWIDTERTADEILDGYERIKRRIVLENNPGLIFDDRFNKVRCFSFIGYSHPEDRVKEFERLVSELNPFVVVLDGVGDFVSDINDPKECNPVIGKIIALSNEYQFTTLATIHPNPGEGNGSKPRGHFGSELVRKSGSVLLLKRAPDDRDVRILTTNFMHGKNRSATDSLDHYFSWSDTDKMFTSCDYITPKRSTKGDLKQDAFTTILDGNGLRYKELIDRLMKDSFCQTEPTAKKWVSDMTKKGFILNTNGFYEVSK